MAIVASSFHALRDGSRCVVRTALREDGPRVREACLEIFASTDSVLTCADEFTLTNVQESEYLESRAHAATGLYLIAERDIAIDEAAPGGAMIVGIAGLDPYPKRRAAHNAYLGMMVREGFRGKGVGDALMQELLRFARACPLLRRVQLEVLVENTRAVELYKRHGFVIEGTRRGCFQRVPGVYEDDYVMACDVV